MQFLMKRPTLLFCVVLLALFVGRVSRHGGWGFHQW
jgi:hypothetical protein